MEKLKSLPHKNLFYFGFIIVIIFLILSYWQFSRYKTNESESYDKVNQDLVSIDEINLTPSDTYIKLNGSFNLIDY